jgi:hypothetical protein
MRCDQCAHQSWLVMTHDDWMMTACDYNDMFGLAHVDGYYKNVYIATCWAIQVPHICLENDKPTGLHVFVKVGDVLRSPIDVAGSTTPLLLICAVPASRLRCASFLRSPSFSSKCPTRRSGLGSD